MALTHTHVDVLVSALQHHRITDRVDARMVGAALLRADIDAGSGRRYLTAPAPDPGVHPIAVLAVAEHALDQLRHTAARTLVEQLWYRIHGNLDVGHRLPLTVAGADFGRPTYQHSAIYRSVVAELTTPAQLPRHDTNPEFVVAPYDFAAAPDVIGYRPIDSDATAFADRAQLDTALAALGALCDRAAVAAPESGENLGSARWAQQFAGIADPLIATTRANPPMMFPRSVRDRRYVQLAVSVLARHEILPAPPHHLLADLDARTAWTSGRTRPTDYLIISSDRIRAGQRAAPTVPMATTLAAHLGRSTFTHTALGHNTHAWSSPTGRSDRNRLAEHLAAALGAPDLTLHGTVALTTATPDHTGQLPALPHTLLTTVYRELAGWRHHQHSDSGRDPATAAAVAARPLTTPHPQTALDPAPAVLDTPTGAGPVVSGP
ncbi:hypothetical protein ACWDUL_38425 [Nocardia niigatensis]